MAKNVIEQIRKHPDFRPDMSDKQFAETFGMEIIWQQSNGSREAMFRVCQKKSPYEDRLRYLHWTIWERMKDGTIPVEIAGEIAELVAIYQKHVSEVWEESRTHIAAAINLKLDVDREHRAQISRKGGKGKAEATKHVTEEAQRLANLKKPSDGWRSAEQACEAIYSEVQVFAKREYDRSYSRRKVADWLREAGIKAARTK